MVQLAARNNAMIEVAVPFESDLFVLRSLVIEMMKTPKKYTEKWKIENIKRCELCSYYATDDLVTCESFLCLATNPLRSIFGLGEFVSKEAQPKQSEVLLSCQLSTFNATEYRLHFGKPLRRAFFRDTSEFHTHLSICVDALIEYAFLENL